MASTLAHGVAGRRRWGWRAAARVAVAAAVLAVVLARSGDGDPLLPDRVRALGPAEAGRYRLVGTEEDSRTGRTVATAEVFTVDPWFEVDGVEHQVTRMGDVPGGEAETETAFREDGAYRLRQTAGGVSQRWEPPLLTFAAPLEVGRSWTGRSTATVPDVAGFRRVTEVRSRGEVTGATTVEVAGHRVRVLVVETWTRTTVTSTRRTDGVVTTTTRTTEGRSWFSPRHMLVVRSELATTIAGDPAGPDRYEVVRRARLERLTPS